MQFKYPEFFYAFFILLIPIIVHLFKLRKFYKQEFTNVRFLKQLKLQSQKKRNLKKWLVLFTRLAALSCLILAFAQPYYPQSNDDSIADKSESYIYLDNSFSMQQPDKQGDPLLKSAVQHLIQNYPADQNITVLTNDEVFPKVDLADIKNELLDLDYTPTDLSLKTILLKIDNLSQRGSKKNIAVISDFQKPKLSEKWTLDSLTSLSFVQLKGNDTPNFSLDSLYFLSANSNKNELEIKVSASQVNSETLPISIFDDEKPLAKTSVTFVDDSVATAQITLQENTAVQKGRIEIEDQNLQFDNKLFFSIHQNEKIKIVAVGSQTSGSAFLKKIYDYPLFDFVYYDENKIAYNQFEDANLILLNELENIPAGLLDILQKHIGEGKNICFIPSENQVANQQILQSFQLPDFSPETVSDLKITTIRFDHPLYKNVFEKEVNNFQYPSVKKSFVFPSTGSSPVLLYNDGDVFLTENRGVYIFTASLNTDNGNFIHSPLVVPTFFNIAQQSANQPQLYYTLGREQNRVRLSINLSSDEVLQLEKDGNSFIPRQKKFNEHVDLLLNDFPEEAGTYEIGYQSQPVDFLSFNDDRNENKLFFANINLYKNVQVNSGLKEFIQQEINKNEVDQLWKWFVIFAAGFLLLEVVFLKILK